MPKQGNIEMVKKGPEITPKGPAPEVANKEAQDGLEHAVRDFQSPKDREYREKFDGLDEKFMGVDRDYDTRNKQLTSAGDALQGATTESDHDSFLKVIEGQRRTLKNRRKTQEENIALDFSREGQDVVKEANTGTKAWHEAMKLKRAPEELNKKGRLTQIGEKDPTLSEEDIKKAKEEEKKMPERFRKKEVTPTTSETRIMSEQGTKEINAIREGKTKIEEGIYKERTYSPSSLWIATTVDNFAEDIRVKRATKASNKKESLESNPTLAGNQ